MAKKHIITLSGHVGSGKSTAGKAIAKELGYKHYSAGDMMREMAEEEGLTFIEFGKIVETTSPESKEYNKRLDERSGLIADREGEEAVIDGHIAFHFAKGAFKVYLDIDPEVAIARIGAQKRANESYESEEDLRQQVLWREQSHRDRFKNLYDVDIRDMSHYDFVLNTGLPENDVPTVVAKVIEAYTNWLNN